MARQLANASLFALLALATLSVVWSGLNWPPPLWIVEYGLPGSQGPTGRVARIEGIEFVELPSGYCWLGGINALEGESLLTRLAAELGHMPEASLLPGPGAPGNTWVRVPGPFWVSRHRLSWRERSSLIGFGVGSDHGLRCSEWEERSYRQLVLPAPPAEDFSRDDLVFSLPPDREHLVEPYLVEGE